MSPLWTEIFCDLTGNFVWASPPPKKILAMPLERILRFIIFDNTVYSLFNYLVAVMAIFVTIYNYRAHNYFITIVMKFRNYFPSSTNYNWYFLLTSNSNCSTPFLSSDDTQTHCFWLFLVIFLFKIHSIIHFQNDFNKTIHFKCWYFQLFFM